MSTLIRSVTALGLLAVLAACSSAPAAPTTATAAPVTSVPATSTALSATASFPPATATPAAATATPLPAAPASRPTPSDEPTAEPTPTGAVTPSPAVAASSGASAPPFTGSASPVPSSGEDPWVRTATEFRGQDQTRLAYWCPPGGQEHTIWGTDHYTDDSSVCTAAVHAGAITYSSGGFVVIVIEQGMTAYTGSLRNGVESHSYGAWDGSFAVVQR